MNRTKQKTKQLLVGRDSVRRLVVAELEKAAAAAHPNSGGSGCCSCGTGNESITEKAD